MGSNCSNAYVAIYHWSTQSNALNPTLKIAYLGWIVLMSSVIVLLRVVGRGRSGWEPATLLLLAILPPVFMSVATYFHPQDLIAMGLALFATAALLRDRWGLAGALLGLSFASQQFALLVFVPLLFIVPTKRRFAFLASVIAAIAVVDGPFIVASSGRAFKTVMFGSSRLTLFGSSHFHAAGGTWLFATNLHGTALFVIARALPIICASATAVWAARRLGEAVTEAPLLLSLVATTLGMRLVFEENLFGYYFMALAVALLCGEAIRGRFRGELFVWLALVVVAFDPIPWWLYLKWEVRGLNLYFLLPLLFEIAVVGAFVKGAQRHQFRWYLVASAVIVALTSFPPLWGRPWTNHFAPDWLWQLILVPTGLLLAYEPLRKAISGAAPSNESLTTYS